MFFVLKKMQLSHVVSMSCNCPGGSGPDCSQLMND